LATPDYCTARDVQAALPDGNWGETYDDVLASCVTRASRAIDAYLKRAPGAFAVSDDSTRYFDGTGGAVLWPGEFIAVTSLSVAETGDPTAYTLWAATDYVLWPYNAAAEGMPYERIDLDTLYGTKTMFPRYRKAVKVVGKFGYSGTVPDEVQAAAIIEAARLFKRGQAGYQDYGGNPALGQVRVTAELDPQAAQVLAAARFGRLTI